MLNARRVVATMIVASVIAACTSAGPRTAARPEGALSGRVVALTGRPFAIRVSATGVVLVTQQDDNSVARFQAADKAPAATIAVGRDPGDVVFSSDGSQAFVTAFLGGGLHVIDLTTNRVVAAIRIASGAYRLAIMPDDSRLFVTSTNGRLYVVDPSEPRVVDSLQLAGALQGIALTPSGRTLVVTSTQGGIWKIDVATLSVARSNVITGGLQDVAITANESEIYVANERFGVDVLDGTTLARRDRISLTAFAPFGLAMTRDETELYVTSPTTGSVKIVDIRARTVVYTLNVRGTPRRVAFDASGRAAFIANEADWVDVIR
jgi:DNA-binding beta-propeller fold protein YncE